MQFGNVLHLLMGKASVAGHSDKSDPGLRPRHEMKSNIGLLRIRMLVFGHGHQCAVISVLLHEMFDARHRPIEFFRGEKFSQLELGGIHQLVGRGAARTSLYHNLTDKKIRGSDET